MGFWDMAEKVGKAAINTVQEKVERIERYKSQYDRYSDEELLDLVKRKSVHGEAGIAVLQLLKERGYRR